MYNVYTHDKKQKEEHQSTLKPSLKHSEQTREVLSARYKERINKTLLGLSKEAESIKKHSRAQTAGTTERSWLKSTGFITEQERIQESVTRSQWLDTTPCQKQVFKLRPRDKSKEIQPSFRFKAKSGNERLEEYVKQLRGYLDSSDPPGCRTRSLCKGFDGSDKVVFSGGKEVLRYYHNKTYFKTIESLALDLHSSTRNMSKAEVKQKSDQEKLGMTEGKLKSKTVVEEALCKEDIMPISADLLEKIGIWESKKTYDPRIRSRLGTPKWVYARMKGEGRTKKTIL